MSNEVIVAIISGGFVAITTIISNVLLSNKQIALIDYKIQELSRKVEKHNNVVERVALLERDGKTMWKVIDELKGELHG